MITEEQVTKLKRLIDDRKTLEDKLKRVNNFIPEDSIKVKFKYRDHSYSNSTEIYCNYNEIIEILKEKLSSEIDQINEKINSLTIVEVNSTLEI
jgi:hypothetical protein